MMHHGAHAPPPVTFKKMEGEGEINTKRTEEFNSVVDIDNNSTAGSDSTSTMGLLSVSPEEEEDGGAVTGGPLSSGQTSLQQQCSMETTGLHLSMQEEDIVPSDDENVTSDNQRGSERLGIMEDIEKNTTMSSTTAAGGDDSHQDDGQTLADVVTLEQAILCQSSVETTGQLLTQELIVSPFDDDVSLENQLNSEKCSSSVMADKASSTATIDGDDTPQEDGICLNDSQATSGSVTLEKVVSSVETTVELSMQDVIRSSNGEDVSSENRLNSEQPENTSMPSTTTDSDDSQKADSLCLEYFQTLSSPVTADLTISCQSSVETTGQLPVPEVNDEDVSSENQINSEQLIMKIMEDKENSVPSTSTTTDGGDDVQQDESLCLKGLEVQFVTPTKRDDAEMVKRAQEEGCVHVEFPGTVTQDGCRRFVQEILKCILYQRQQLPMTYDQLKHSQKCHSSKQNKEMATWRPVHSADMGWRKGERSLQELDTLLEQLEVLFSLSLVPRVLLLLGGSVILPKELYEINMEALILSSVDKSLRVSSCLRQLFHTLFVTDLLSDCAPVRLCATTVLVLAHRECGVGWFRPKLGFKVPTRVKRHIIALSTDVDTCSNLQTERSDWEEYIWFQAPTAIKGFSS